MHQISTVDGRRSGLTCKLSAIGYSPEIFRARTAAQATRNFIHVKWIRPIISVVVAKVRAAGVPVTATDIFHTKIIGCAYLSRLLNVVSRI